MGVLVITCIVIYAAICYIGFLATDPIKYEEKKRKAKRKAKKIKDKGVDKWK
jgi:hypothetical protein